MGNSNFTSRLSKGISFLCLWEFFLAVDLELVLEEEEVDGEEGGGLGGSSPSSLLAFEYSPRIGLFRYNNHHIKPLPSLTWRRKSFETLSRHEKVPLPMPSSHFEKFSFLIQSQDSLQQARLHHDSSFPW
jgi:hypothetical protein